MKSDFVFFWGGPFSNFYPAKIKVNGVEFFCTEQFFMSCKALHFGDTETNELIMKAKDPKTAKALGRKVKNFDSVEWDKVSRDYMYEGNYAKYTQHPNLKKELLATSDKILAESSPYDKIWGLGLSEEDAKNINPEDWPGTNWLGEVLMKVRDELKKLD